MDQIFDIAVVGAGPAGSVAAFSAATRGLKVALIDRQTFPRDKPCGDGIGPVAVQVIQELGLGDIFDGYTPIKTVSVFGPTGDLAQIEVPKINGIAASGYVIPRIKFDNQLFSYALEAGAEDFSGMRFLDMSLAGNSRTITLRNRNGDISSLSARLVIGADGAYSAVRRSLIPNEGPMERHAGLAIRAYAECPDLRSNSEQESNLIFEFSRNLLPSYGWVFPVGNGMVNIGVGGPLPRLQRQNTPLKEMLTNFANQVRSRGINLGQLGKMQAHQLPAIAGIPRLRHQRAVLIGDAASMINPTSGEGVGYGVAAAAQLISQLPTDLDNEQTLNIALSKFERDFLRKHRWHFASSRAVVALLQQPTISNVMVRAMQKDPKVLSDSVEMLFGLGHLHISTGMRVLKAVFR